MSSVLNIGFIVGIIVLMLGIALMYTLPDYVINTLAQTGTFDNQTVDNAKEKAEQARAIGFTVIIIGLIFLVVSVLRGL